MVSPRRCLIFLIGGPRLSNEKDILPGIPESSHGMIRHDLVTGDTMSLKFQITNPFIYKIVNHS
jgi:hypothetical protein